MTIETLIADIEGFGPNKADLPARSQKLFDKFADDPRVQDAIEVAAEVQAMLAEWEEDENGATVEEPELPEMAEGETKAEDENAKTDAPLFDISVEEIADAVGDMEDITSNLAATLRALATEEMSKERYPVMTRDHDAIVPIPVRKDADVSTLDAAVGAQTRVMAKVMQRLIAARSLAVNQAGLRRGKINAASLHRMEVNDDRVFRKRVEGQTLDVAISLLVDLSGSMRGGKLSVAVQSAYAFSDVLDRLGVKHEVIGFTTHGDFDWTPAKGGFPREGRSGSEQFGKDRAEFCSAIGQPAYNVRWEPLLMPLFKTFGERLDVNARKRFASAAQRSFISRLIQNIDGESLRIAAGRLKAQKASRHILMAFSDGSPCSEMDSNLLAYDLRMAVKEVSKSGVDLIGVGIMDTNASHYYPKSVTVNEISELSTTVMNELKKLLL